MATNRTPLEPQTSIAHILRPPSNFEAVYEGQLIATPLPFVAPDAAGRYVPLDARAGNPGVQPALARYVPVPLGASLYILIPRAFYPVDEEVEEGIYTYELRWRLRTLQDWQKAAAQNNPTVPYHLITQEGAPDPSLATPELITLPSFTSEATVPTSPGAGQQVLVSPAAFGVATQGLFDPSVVGATTAFAPNNYFPPLIRRALGDELSIVAYRTGGDPTWEFEGDDAGIKLVYGNDFPGVGIVLLSLAGSPAAATG